MEAITLFGTVEEIAGGNAVILADATDNLYECEKFVTQPALQPGDIVRLSLTPQDDINAIAIDYNEMGRRYSRV